MNKQSNTYTVIYIIVLVVVVGAALAMTALGLRPQQQENIRADKMKQILASVHIVPSNGNVTADFNRYITRSFVVNDLGEEVPGNAFDIPTTAEAKKPASERLLPVYECTLPDGSIKYIVALDGAGLWGPIWGYVALDADGSTVYGAYFAHQGETPGLGAEIEKPDFQKRFDGKQLFKDGHFLPIAVVKPGQTPAGDEDYVDGISGGTITSKGVGSMIDNCIGAYSKFLQSLSEKSTR